MDRIPRAAQPAFGHNPFWGRSGWGPTPGSKENYARIAGPLHDNAAVRIGLNWISKNFGCGQLQLQGKRANAENWLAHPLLDLIQQPNPSQDFVSFSSLCILSYIVAGNVYLKIATDGYGVPEELWWLNHDEVQVYTDPGSGDFITSYRVPRTGEVFAPEEVIHVRAGSDPHDPRKGLSCLSAVLREVASDNSASTYTASILRKGGALPVIVSPKDEQDYIEPEDKDALKKEFRAKSADGAGDVLILSGPASVTPIGQGPEQLTLDKIRHFPEDRIAAAMGLNTIALGLTSGAASKTYANYEQAVRSCYHSCLFPLEDAFLKAWNGQLVPRYPGLAGRQLAWDREKVPALQEDATAKTNRGLSLYTAGILDRYEVRTDLGYEADEAKDRGVYYGGTTIPTPDKPADDA